MLQKNATIHCLSRLQVLLCLKSSMNLGAWLQFFLHFCHSTFITNQSWEVPVLPHRRYTLLLFFTCHKSSWKCTKQPLEPARAGGMLSTTVSVQLDTWIQAHIISILLQGMQLQGGTRRLSQESTVLPTQWEPSSCNTRYIYTHTQACLTVTTYLCVNIYEIFSFLEKEKVHSAGP